MTLKKLLDFFVNPSEDMSHLITILESLNKTQLLEPDFLKSLKHSVLNLNQIIQDDESRKKREREILIKSKSTIPLNREDSQKLDTLFEMKRNKQTMTKEERADLKELEKKSKEKMPLSNDELEMLDRINLREDRIKYLRGLKRRKRGSINYIGLTEFENAALISLKAKLKGEERINVPQIVTALENLADSVLVNESTQELSDFEEGEREEAEVTEEGEVSEEDEAAEEVSEEDEAAEEQEIEELEVSERLSQREKILFLELDLKKNKLPEEQEKELLRLENEDFCKMKLNSLKKKEEIAIMQKILKFKQKDGTINEEEQKDLDILLEMSAKSAGMNSARTEGYSLPKDVDFKAIERDEKLLEELNSSLVPDDVFYVDMEQMKKDKKIRGSRKSRWFKPIKIECYNINREKLIDIGRKKIQNHEFINEISVHGASHSIAMIITVIKQNLDYDFFYHANLLMEMDHEEEYLKYIMLVIFKDYKLPLVIATREEGLETTFTERGAFPTMYKRWCTEFFKIKPAYFLFKYLWHEFLLEEVPYTKRYIKMMESQRTKLLALVERTPKQHKKLQIIETNLKLKVKNKNGISEKQWNKNHVLLMQGLGIQSHQSPGRSAMSPFPVLSDMSDDKLLVFNIMPVFRVPENYKNHPDIKSGEDFNKFLLKEIGAFQNINERKFGRHGCLICNYAGWKFFQYLKDNYPELHNRAITIRDWANKKYFAGKSEYEIYRVGHEISEKAIREYEKETRKTFNGSPF